MESLTLIQLSPDWRPALLEMVQDYQTAGEDRCQSILSMNDEEFFAYLRSLEDESREENLPPDVVPQSTYWMAQDNNLLIGSVRIRHKLNPLLEQEGGNIGFTVRPSERGKGYGKKLLAMAIQKAAELGMETALITCDEENPAARHIIESNGGELIDTITSKKSGRSIHRFRVAIPQSTAGPEGTA